MERVLFRNEKTKSFSCFHRSRYVFPGESLIFILLDLFLAAPKDHLRVFEMLNIPISNLSEFVVGPSLKKDLSLHK